MMAEEKTTKLEIVLSSIATLTVLIGLIFLGYTYITQGTQLKAIKDCSGSPSCIESTVAAFEHRYPCLDHLDDK